MILYCSHLDTYCSVYSNIRHLLVPLSPLNIREKPKSLPLSGTKLCTRQREAFYFRLSDIFSVKKRF